MQTKKEKIPYPICSVVAVFKMLVRILNTLQSRIWDMVFFLFSVYSKSTVGENGDCPEVYGFYFFCWCPLLFFLWRNSSLIKNHILLENLHLPIQDLNTDFHLEPKTENQKFIQKRKCDVGASKNAGQAFSTPRLSSHVLFYINFWFSFLFSSTRNLQKVFILLKL